MGRSIRLTVWFLLITAGIMCYCSFPVQGGLPQEQTVAFIPIQGTIDPGLENYVERSLEQAAKEGAAAVILELDTPGGYIKSATKIRRLLDRFPGRVYAFINPKAASAGAYLALAAEEIYMVPASTMGAAEPGLLGVGEVGEKQLSDWDSEMRSMAERRERDPAVASAMVRKELAIPGIVEEGKLLSFTAAEALSAGYSEGTVVDRAEMLHLLNLSGAEIMEFSPGVVDNLITWTTNPVIATILLIIGIGGLILEVFTAGFGAAGLLSMLAFTIYFGGHIAAEMAEYWVALLFIFGVAMLLTEAFMPGLGIFGIAGLGATVSSIVLAASSVKTGLIMLALALLLAGVFAFFAFRFFERRGALRHIFLADAELPELGYVAAAHRADLLGKEGKAVTSLRPAGTVEIEGRRVDVVSEGGFIPSGEKVKVIFVEGMRVVVRSLKTGDS